MHKETVDKGRISLGCVRHSLQSIVSIEDPLKTQEVKKESVVFMKILAETRGSKVNALALMTNSYASYLNSGFESVMLSQYKWVRSHEFRTVIRGFICLFEMSDLRSVQRAQIPPRMRDHAGIPPYGRVFVAERNGYAVISPNQELLAEIEAAPWNALATTIDHVVAGIASEEHNLAQELLFPANTSKILKV